MADQKPYISDSQLRMLTRCGIQYENRYVMGEIIPPGIAAVRGIGVHRAAAANGQQKIESGSDHPLG